MLSPREGRTRWLYTVPLVLVLLIVAGAAYAIKQASAAQVAPIAGNLPKVAGNTVPSDLKPGEKVVLPNGTIIGLDAHHDLSPALRDIPPVAVKPTNENGIENPYVPLPPMAHIADTIAQRMFGPLVVPSPVLTFEGISAVTSGCGCYPPDTNGAVGPNNYVQTVNTAFEIWDKSGNVLLTARAINTLFSGFGGACQTQNSGDPVVNYDRLADRWVISQFTSSKK